MTEVPTWRESLDAVFRVAVLFDPYVEESRNTNSPRSDWPVLWDCERRGYARIENPASPISPRPINAALGRAAEMSAILVKVTAHTAKHTYCTNWITEKGDTENSMEGLPIC